MIYTELAAASLRMIKAIYLCGPINGCTDEECIDWREHVKLQWPNCIDPMRRDYRGREDECVSEIVEGDKGDIDECDVLLVNFPGPSVGAAMEMFYAWQSGKYVYVVCAPGTPLSPWLKYHSHKIFYGFDAALRAIQMLPYLEEAEE